VPTRNVSLTDELDKFVASKIAEGLYANPSEVMRVALRNLERDDREFEAKLVALRAAIGVGDDSDAAEDADEATVLRLLEAAWSGSSTKECSPMRTAYRAEVTRPTTPTSQTLARRIPVTHLPGGGSSSRWLSCGIRQPTTVAYLA
jgi:antitoxin ParD1/3/4